MGIDVLVLAYAFGRAADSQSTNRYLVSGAASRQCRYRHLFESATGYLMKWDSTDTLLPYPLYPRGDAHTVTCIMTKNSFFFRVSSVVYVFRRSWSWEPRSR